jgi:predicted ATPase
MITKIEVDGFKSLTDFDLCLNTGLNILVGPNGAGKTNIILFFEFLSNIFSNQIGNAISNVGGAGFIFQKIGKEDYKDTITCKIYGSYKAEPDQHIIYEYSFQIKISFENDDIFYSHQNIKIGLTSQFWKTPDAPEYPTKWDIDISYSFKGNKQDQLTIHNINKETIKTRFIRTEVQQELEDDLKEYLSHPEPAHNSIIGNIASLDDDFYPIKFDLQGGENFSISPSKVRESEDSATPPGIKKDGSGLATTLYAIKKRRPIINPATGRFWLAKAIFSTTTFNLTSLDKITNYLKLANPTITNLDVENDPFSNKLIIKVFIKTGDYESVLPLSSMSDGTIKWLTLITAILTSKTIFSIEEPENFLHPWMQAEIANIMRNHLEEKQTPAFVLMTTHSESLLNYARPEEIIIVDLSEGSTRARRISDVDTIREEIANSGFGLGHFYFSNSLINE